MTASLLTEVCHGVSNEPHLQPLLGEAMFHGSANMEDNVRVDVAVHGFWGGRFEKAFSDVSVPTLAPNRNGKHLCSQCTGETNKRRMASTSNR